MCNFSLLNFELLRVGGRHKNFMCLGSQRSLIRPWVYSCKICRLGISKQHKKAAEKERKSVQNKIKLEINHSWDWESKK